MAEEQTAPAKRGRGRPRKNPLPEPPAPVTSVQKRSISIPTPKLTKKWLVVLVVLLAAGLGGWKYWQQSKALDDLRKKQTYTPSDTAHLVQEVSKVAVLPSGEVPEIAEVKDISKLQGKPFFAQAQDGDKVLVYKKAKRVFIYRLSTHQIVNMADLTTQTNSTDANKSSTPSR
jgi:hypothetical protein